MGVEIAYQPMTSREHNWGELSNLEPCFVERFIYRCSIREVGTMSVQRVRPVRCTVTDNIVGYAIVASYDLQAKRKSNHRYRVPLYNMRLVGHDRTGTIQYYDYKVIRFGVGNSSGGPDFIAGKPEHRVHTLTRVPYMKGSWKLSGYKQVLIHDGADNPLKDFWGAVGCIEVTGVGAWPDFEMRVAELAGTSDFKAISESGCFKCEFLQASPPKLQAA